MRKPLVYLAGPYTSSPVHNTHRVLQVATRIVEDGIVTPHPPHQNMLWDMATPRSERFWLDYDLEIIDHCDAVLRLTGRSSGSDGEVGYASKLRIPIFFESARGLDRALENVYAWAAERSWTQCDPVGI